MNKAVCKKCGLEKVKVWTGKRNGHSKRYVDEAGGNWSGRTCPPCELSFIKLLRERAKQAEEGATVVVKDLNPLTERKCRSCLKALPRSRYFKCFECDTGFSPAGVGFYSADDWGYSVALGVRL